jgi:hypothetical protein
MPPGYKPQRFQPVALQIQCLARVWQLDLDFQHLKVVLALHIHLDVVRIDLDVLADDGNQFALQVR